jgi:hypothetical protein
MAKIRNTLQFLYTEYYDYDSSSSYDVDYTIFIFEDSQIFWREGSFASLSFKKGNSVPDSWRLHELKPFETLPQPFTKEELLNWDND